MVIRKVFYLLFQKVFHGTIKLKTSLLAFIFSLSMYCSFAQLNIVNSEMRMIVIGNNQVVGTCNIFINDTSICNIVSIELIDALNDNQIFSREFVFDQQIGLPAGVMWTRNGNDIEISMGNLPIHSVWKGRIRLKDTSSVWTQWHEFIFN